jgi:hypothetical protein
MKSGIELTFRSARCKNRLIVRFFIAIVDYDGSGGRMAYNENNMALHESWRSTMLPRQGFAPSLNSLSVIWAKFLRIQKKEIAESSWQLNERTSFGSWQEGKDA